jgi:hypothetical protein
MAFTGSNIIPINNDTINRLKGATQETLLKWKQQLESVDNADDGNLYLSLHPIMDRSGFVKCWEILARTRDSDLFPFDWFKTLTKQERVDFTIKCAEFSKLCKSHNINAKFNLQHCDFDDVTRRIDLADTHYEIAEFGQGMDGSIMENGKVKLGGALFPLKSQDDRSDYYGHSETILDKYKRASIDDCFTIERNGEYQDDRCFDRIIEMIKTQGAMKADDPEKAVHTIKIDYSISNKAFNKMEEPYCTDLNNAVTTILKDDPHMQIIVECTVNPNDIQNVPALHNMDHESLLFQGGALQAYAFRVDCYLTM